MTLALRGVGSCALALWRLSVLDLTFLLWLRSAACGCGNLGNLGSC
jgi:hypothetical protein